MALTFKETELVRGSIPFLREHGERVSTMVYKNLLGRHPDLNNTFNPVHQSDGRLARALTVVILRFAGNINNMAELIPKLERVCNKHCTLGVSPEHYQMVGELIIEAFATVMGADFSDEIRAAWEKAYNVLSSMMIGRETHIYKQFGTHGWSTMRKLRVDRKVAETMNDDIYSFYLMVPPGDQTPLPGYMPGQFVTVRVYCSNIGFFQTRQYSLSDAPGKKYFRLTVKRDYGMLYKNAHAQSYHSPGLVSNMLIDQVRPGDEIEVSHPSGDFFLDNTNPAPDGAPLVLISSGSGVAPLVAILNAGAEASSMKPITWIYGTRNDAPFIRHVNSFPNVRRYIFKTQVKEYDAHGKTYDHKGRVSLDTVDLHDLHVDNGATEYYVCGPEQFMKDMVSSLVSKGVAQARIKCEYYSVGELSLDSVPVRFRGI